MVSVAAQDCIPFQRSAHRAELIECLPALREALERERAFRREQLADLILGRSDELTAAERGSTAAESARGEVRAVLVTGARQALSDIERALAAMRVGQYGRCEDCAEEVPVAVLRAVPQARRCLDCHRARSEVNPSVAPDEDGGARAAAPSAHAPAGTGRPARSMQAGKFALTVPPHVSIDEFANDPCRGRTVVWVKQLLGRPIVGPEHQHLGHVRDVVAHRLPDPLGAVVMGLIADAGGRTIVVSAAAVRGWETAASGALEVLRHRRDYRRRPGEVLLAADVLGQPVMTSTAPTVTRVADIALRRSTAGWAVGAVDTRSAVQRVLGCPRHLVEWRALAQRRLVAPPRRGRQARQGEDLPDRDDCNRRGARALAPSGA